MPVVERVLPGLPVAFPGPGARRRRSGRGMGGGGRSGGGGGLPVRGGGGPARFSSRRRMLQECDCSGPANPRRRVSVAVFDEPRVLIITLPALRRILRRRPGNLRQRENSGSGKRRGSEHMAYQKTFIMVKPDGVRRRLVGGGDRSVRGQRPDARPPRDGDAGRGDRRRPLCGAPGQGFLFRSGRLRHLGAGGGDAVVGRVGGVGCPPHDGNHRPGGRPPPEPSGATTDSTYSRTSSTDRTARRAPNGSSASGSRHDRRAGGRVGIPLPSSFRPY